jgi:AraC family transcriptional regulator, transcriptional activator of the genes for pyochelin and ferripyochelin receptors
MSQNKLLKNITSQSWQLNNILISHNIVEYNDLGKTVTENDSEFVRLHFGLKGAYEFKFEQLNASFSLQGQHNNMMYSKGLNIEVFNKTKIIETFGVNFTTSYFIEIAQNGNDLLKRFAEKVMKKQQAILSETWKTNNFKIQQTISEILNCPFAEELRNIFLLSKSIELLVLQAELYETDSRTQFIKSDTDKSKLIEARALLSDLNNTLTIIKLSELVGMNEYKLKRGFKELFGTTIFGFIHKRRMHIAKRLLSDSSKSVKEIAYETGYGSPQHFSKAFKKEFGIAPNSIRKTPDTTTEDEL